MSKRQTVKLCVDTFNAFTPFGQTVLDLPDTPMDRKIFTAAFAFGGWMAAIAHGFGVKNAIEIAHAGISQGYLSFSTAKAEGKLEETQTKH